MNLRIGFWAAGSGPLDISKTQTTDARGRSEIKLPDGQPEWVQIYPSKAGFVPLILHWHSSPAPPVLPRTITVSLEPSTTIGGVVRNEQGKPIPGVIVTINYCDGSGDSPYQGAYVREEKATTDKDGRWQINAMPANISEDKLLIFSTHPDYVSDHLQYARVPWPITERPSCKALRNQTAVMVMRKGAVVEGRVTDETGKPIMGASIYEQEECYYQDSSKTGAVSDTRGHFRIAGLNDIRTARSSDYQSPKTLLTVEAPGYAPELIEASLAKSAPPLAITLKRGYAVQGKVVDERGWPIAGVRVRLDYWQGHPRKLAREATTDATGDFRISDAPWDSTEYDLEKPGYATVRNPMSPWSKWHDVTMRSVVRVVGAIVDAETGKPLAKCMLTEGWEPEDGRAPEWRDAAWDACVDDHRWAIRNHAYAGVVRHSNPRRSRRIHASRFAAVQTLRSRSRTGDLRHQAEEGCADGGNRSRSGRQAGGRRRGSWPCSRFRSAMAVWRPTRGGSTERPGPARTADSSSRPKLSRITWSRCAIRAPP